MRQIVNIEGLIQRIPLTKWQIYKLIKSPKNPLPHRKIGKRLMFDIDTVYRWFDSLPSKYRVE